MPLGGLVLGIRRPLAIVVSDEVYLFSRELSGRGRPRALPSSLDAYLVGRVSGSVTRHLRANPVCFDLDPDRSLEGFAALVG
jgi:hypothetical protein